MKHFGKQVCLVLSLLLCLLFLAACGAPVAEPPKESAAPAVSETPETPVPPVESEPAPEPEETPEPEPEPAPEPDPVPVVDEKEFRTYVFLCKELGAFASPDEVDGAQFFRYFRYNMSYETEEEAAVSPTGKEYFRWIYSFDLNQFDELSLNMFGTTFDYAQIPQELNSNLFQYEYNAETHSVREIIDGMGAGGFMGIEYMANYEGYTTEDNEFYQLNYRYIGVADYGEREFETGVTGIVHVQYVEGNFRILAHEIFGELTYEDPEAK